MPNTSVPNKENKKNQKKRHNGPKTVLPNGETGRRKLDYGVKFNPKHPPKDQGKLRPRTTKSVCGPVCNGPPCSGHLCSSLSARSAVTLTAGRLKKFEGREGGTPCRPRGVWAACGGLKPPIKLANEKCGGSEVGRQTPRTATRPRSGCRSRPWARPTHRGRGPCG